MPVKGLTYAPHQLHALFDIPHKYAMALWTSYFLVLFALRFIFPIFVCVYLCACVCTGNIRLLITIALNEGTDVVNARRFFRYMHPPPFLKFLSPPAHCLQHTFTPP